MSNDPQDPILLDEMPATYLYALRRVAEFRLETNLPTSRAEWETFAQNNKPLVNFAESLVYDVLRMSPWVPGMMKSHNLMGASVAAAHVAGDQERKRLCGKTWRAWKKSSKTVGG